MEDRHRGSRELIKERLEVYLPFVREVLKAHSGAKAVDLGCGRGEWLELLQQNGAVVVGIDQDEGMLQACKERNLPVEHGDALAYLEGLPDASVAVVTGFHIAEHLPFDDLQRLFREAFRVLEPTGQLILEVPNPENLVVASTNFYIDPTHVKPLPPQLLAFLAEYYEFDCIKVLRLHESPVLADKQSLSLWDVISGASPDFAIVAQKTTIKGNADAEQSMAFRGDFGVDLHAIATRYEEALSGRLSTVEKNIGLLRSFEEVGLRVEADLENQQIFAKSLQDELSNARRQMDLLAERVEKLNYSTQLQEAEWKKRMNAAETRFAHLIAELEGVYRSRSWRLTKPLRSISAAVKRLLGKWV